MNSFRNVSSTFILRFADASRHPQLGRPSASFNSSHVSTARTVPVTPRLNSHLLPTTTIGTYGLRRRPGHPLGPAVDDVAFVSNICSCSRFTSWNDSRLSMLYTRMNKSPVSHTQNNLWSIFYQQIYSFRTISLNKARFPFKRNRLRCVRCVNENRKKRKRLRWQAVNHGCHCFNRAFL